MTDVVDIPLRLLKKARYISMAEPLGPHAKARRYTSTDLTSREQYPVCSTAMKCTPMCCCRVEQGAHDSSFKLTKICQERSTSHIGWQSQYRLLARSVSEWLLRHGQACKLELARSPFRPATLRLKGCTDVCMYRC